MAAFPLPTCSFTSGPRPSGTRVDLGGGAEPAFIRANFRVDALLGPGIGGEVEAIASGRPSTTFRTMPSTR